MIATLGGDSLAATIGALNRGTVVPAEILLCIPKDEAPRASNLSGPNVRLQVTECRGQVAQRAVGFRSASHPVVLQLDDDLIVAEDCLERLLETLERHGPMAAVSPALIDRATAESLYKKPDRSRIFESLYYRIMNGSAGYQPGRVQKSCGAVGVDPTREPRDLYQVEWLPGGCIMHYRDNLVVDDFYPFKGKAYCEDIIHSHYLTSRGITLIVDPRARCGVESAFDSSLGVRAFVREVAADFRARRHFMHLTGRRPLHLFVFVVARSLAYLGERSRRALQRP